MAEQKQLKLIHDLVSAYQQMSIPTLTNLLHPDYAHVTRPNSLGIPKQNKTQTLEYFQTMFDNWAKMATPNVRALANSPGKIVVHITSDVTLKSGSLMSYESVIDYRIAEDSSGKMTISYCDEFIDVNAFTDGFAPFVEA